MKQLVLALDQGTTSSRAVVFDRAGKRLSMAQKEITQSYPRPGWVEHDPEEIWASQIGAAHEALARAGASRQDLAAVGIANQRETTIVWERSTGAPIYPAIVWQDRRTAPECEALKQSGRDEMLQRTTGLLADSYFSATKIAWILENVPGARTRAERGELAFGTVDSFLAWRLAKRHVIDVTNASRTLLFDIRRMDWSDELLGLFNIPRAMLPEVVPSSGTLGDCEEFGAPVAGMAGDQQAATFGQACFAPGNAKCTYGTGCFLLMNTGARPHTSERRLLSTVGWRLGSSKPVYAIEGSVFAAGAAVQWLRDGLGIIRTAEETATLAAGVDDTGGVFMVPAFTGLGAPHWDPFARGTLVGLTRGTTRAHIARAVLEAIAFQCRDVLDAMNLDCGTDLRELRVDGGAASNDFLMQFQADIVDVPVARASMPETTALGAAFLAGLATGVWSSEEELAAMSKADRVFEPTMDAGRRAELYDFWQRAVERSRGWASG